MFGTLYTLWYFLILIGIMILLHELGHYLVARLFDVHIEAFSFGFGPRLFGFKRGETDFRICALPLGGYVKMAGEQPGEITETDPANLDPRQFQAKPRWQRFLIILAGPVVNLVLAIAILAGLFMFQFEQAADPPNPVVGVIAPDSAAAQAGLQEGDRILEVDGVVNPNFEDIKRRELVGVGKPMRYVVERAGNRLSFDITPVAQTKDLIGETGWRPQSAVQVSGLSPRVQVAEKAGMQVGDVFLSIDGQPVRTDVELVSLVERSKGSPIRVVYLRDGEPREITVSPVEDTDDNGSKHWRIGAQLRTPPMEIVQLPFGAAVRESVRQNQANAMMLYRLLQGIVAQRMSPKSISGPIGIARMSGEAARQGASSYLTFMAGVSLNLAVVNLLPIPLLDGGSILMLLIEMLMQRDLSLRAKEGIIKVGFAFLMMVIVFVFYNDISKTFFGG